MLKTLETMLKIAETNHKPTIAGQTWKKPAEAAQWMSPKLRGYACTAARS